MNRVHTPAHWQAASLVHAVFCVYVCVCPSQAKDVRVKELTKNVVGQNVTVAAVAQTVMVRDKANTYTHTYTHTYTYADTCSKT